MSSSRTAPRIFSSAEWNQLYSSEDYAKKERSQPLLLHFLIAKNQPEATILSSINSGKKEKLIAHDRQVHNLTPLIIAAMKGNERIVEELLKQDLVKQNINACDEYGWTALHHAALTSDAIFQKLIAAGANPNCLTNLEGTPDDLRALTTWGVKANSLQHVSFEGKPLTEETAQKTFEMKSYRDIPFFPPESLKNLWQQDGSEDMKNPASQMFGEMGWKPPKLSIAALPEGFYGLCADQDICAGEVIGIYGGGFKKLTELFDSFPFAFPPRGNEENAYVFNDLDAKEIGNATRFINHGFGNATAFGFVGHGAANRIFIAHAPIKKGEPILFNYGSKAYETNHGPQILFNRTQLRESFSGGIAKIENELKKFRDQINNSTSFENQFLPYIQGIGVRDILLFPLDNPIALIDLHYSGTLCAKEWLKRFTEGENLWLESWQTKNGMFMEALAKGLITHMLEIDRDVQTKEPSTYPLLQKWVLEHCQTLRIMDLVKGIEWVRDALVVSKNPDLIAGIEERLKTYDWTKDESNPYSYTSRRAAVEKHIDFTLGKVSHPRTFFSQKAKALESLQSQMRKIDASFSGSSVEKMLNEIEAGIPKDEAAQITYLTEVNKQVGELKKLYS